MNEFTIRGPSNAWHITGAQMMLPGVTNVLVVVSLSPLLRLVRTIDVVRGT